MPHSKGDDDRQQAEVQAYWNRDPLSVFSKTRPDEARRLLALANARVDKAVAGAEAAPYPSPSAIAQTVLTPVNWKACHSGGKERVVNLIYAALRRNMERDERIMLIGEDIEWPYGGAFKVTKDLSDRFSDRVRNTPISEAAIIGIGNGLALSDQRPVCEIMFGDFMTLAMDQFLNHAAKFRYMYNDRVRVPLIIRTAIGGKRGYGPTHSQSLEKHFLGVPDTQVLSLNHHLDPGRVYDKLFDTLDRPTLVLEDKLLYGLHVTSDSPAGFIWEHTDEVFPTLRLRPLGRPDLTLLCYGAMLVDAEKAVDRLFDQHDLVAEIICPVQLYPFNLLPLLDSVLVSRRLLIVEEGQGFAAFGAEVLAQLVEHAPGSVVKSRRVCAPPCPIPSSKPLEMALLPGEEHIVQAARQLVVA